MATGCWIRSEKRPRGHANAKEGYMRKTKCMKVEGATPLGTKVMTVCFRYVAPGYAVTAEADTTCRDCKTVIAAYRRNPKAVEQIVRGK